MPSPLITARLPRLTHTPAALMREVQVFDEFGTRRLMQIPAERPLTVYVNKREVVTLMTLGAEPELLTLGYLRNQRLVCSLDEVDSITVDWEVAAAAVKTHRDIDPQAVSQRTVTTGCGQGTMYGALMDQIEGVKLPPPSQARIHQSQLPLLNEAMRKTDSVHRSAGSVHGCALFCGNQMLTFVEDVGRHNAIDTIAGWMWMQGDEVAGQGADKLFYTTGRLTSEMVIKAAQLSVPIVISRNGVTQMGYELAQRLGMTLIGRASHRHFICYTGFDRFDAEPLPRTAQADSPSALIKAAAL
jgi:FdhD protein